MPYANAARRTMRAETNLPPREKTPANRSYLRSVISRRGYTPQPEVFRSTRDATLRI